MFRRKDLTVDEDRSLKVRMDERDAAAVARACAGDTDAFRVLVDRYSRKIFRLAYRMTRNEHDAEDVVQETFLRAYRRLRQFESRSSFGTWIFRIAVNAALDLTRKLGRYEQAEQPMPEPEGGAHPLSQLPAPEPAPDRLLLSGELKHKVESVLASLSPQVRTAFVLRHYEGMSIEEIGSVLGLKGSATKNSIYRAVQKLRKELEPLVVAQSGEAPPTRGELGSSRSKGRSHERCEESETSQ
jgi:RNA polymerase sigma-70 factor (ECF subfamily)